MNETVRFGPLLEPVVVFLRLALYMPARHIIESAAEIAALDAMAPCLKDLPTPPIPSRSRFQIQPRLTVITLNRETGEWNYEEFLSPILEDAVKKLEEQNRNMSIDAEIDDLWPDDKYEYGGMENHGLIIPENENSGKKFMDELLRQLEQGPANQADNDSPHP